MSQKIITGLKSFFIHLSHSFRRIGNHIIVSTKLFSRSPGTVFLLIIFPIILMLLFGSIFATPGTPIYHLEIQDKDNTSFSLGLIMEFENNDLLEINILNNNIDPILYLQENNFPCCLIIPVNWTANRLNPFITTSNVTLIIDSASSSYRRIVEIVSSTIRNFDIENSPEEFLINLDVNNFFSDNISYINFFIPGIIGIIILNTGILGTINRQVDFRTSGLYRKFASTPFTRWEYAIAEIIWQFLIAFTTIIITIFTSWIVFGFSWSTFDILIIPILLAGITMFSGIGLLISQLLRNSRNALAIGTLITIPIIFLSGAFFDITGITSLVVISKFSPLTFIVEALRACMITGNNSYASENIGIASAIGILAIILGVFSTRWDQEKL